MGINRRRGAAGAHDLPSKKTRTAKSLGRCLKSRRLTLEPLEQRTLLAAGMIDLGPSDNIALDQPRVAIELLTPTGPGPDDWGSVGPSMFNTFLLDTGANGILAMATAVDDMSQAPYVYETQGTFLEVGVAGDHEMDISVPYRFDFAGTSGVRNTIDDARLMSDPNIDFSMFGPWGLVGMPAMVDRVTSIDMSVWSAGGSLEDLFMRVDFSDDLPADPGHRYSVPVDNRIQFDPVAQTTEGDPPVWGDVPFLTAIPTSNGLGLEGNFLFDTGAQMSVISQQMALDLGLDANGNGSLDDEAIRFETVGGVGGTVTAPVLFIDEVRVPTEEGVDLVWTDLQWLALDIDLPGTEMTLDGVFGSDLLTSGWVEAFFNGGDDGYFQQVHFDFRSMNDDGTGAILFDVTPAVDQVIPPGPGVRVLETLGYTEVAEGGTEDFYRLVLTSQPASDVTIQFTSVDEQISVDSEAVPGTGSITFTSDNWDQPQIVRVVATNDDLAEGPHASKVTHTVVSTATGYSDLAVRAVDVDILDDDLSLLTVVESNDSTIVAEGGENDSFTVQLGSAPTTTTYVLVEDTAFQTLVWREGSSPADLDGNLLTFNSGNWDTPQTVIVRAQDDEDAEGPHQTALTLSVVDGTTVRVIGQSALSVHIEDNDIGSVVLSETLDSTDVSEDGVTDTYSFALGKQPTHDVRIDLEDVAGQLAAVDSAHPENAFLLFTPDNWNTPQTVLVSAVDDAAAEGTHISQIAHRATSDDSGYDGLAIRDVRVRIEDNDGAGVVIEQTGGSTELTEGGTADTYSIHLTSQPAADVRLNLVTGDQIVAVDNINPANAFLLFTPDNWDTAQVVRVTAVDDHIVETTAEVVVAHEALSTDANYRGTHNLTVHVTDNDTADVVITETGDMTTAIEGGTGDAYTVVLTSQPTHNVTVRLDVDTQVTADTTQLVFTPENWDTVQTVEVHAVDDSLVEGAHQGMIVHAVTSDDTNYHELTVAPVDVGITDNDTADVVITESGNTTTAVEGGAGDAYTVVLTSQPTHNVTVRLDVDTQVTTDTTQLVFTPENWDTAQTVEVHAVDDSLVEGAHQGMIVHAVTSDDTDYHELTVAPVDVGITDNDTADVVITESGNTTTAVEGGAGDAYTVVLTSQPTHNVTVRLDVDTQVTADTTQLVFTPENWDTAQTVEVHAVDDSLVEGAHQGMIVHAVTSDDTNYHELTVAPVDVGITDNDTAGVVITESGNTTTAVEGGTGDAYTVVLTSQPTHNVTVRLDVDTQVTADTTQLVFTPENWHTAQTVEVHAVDDSLVEGAHQGMIVHAVTSDDTNYHELTVAPVDVGITDNDALPLGQIDSTALSGLDPSVEPLWYSLETTHAGILTLEATPAEPGGDVTLTLHDSTGSEPALASSTFSDGKARLDWNVQANETYRVRVTGSAADVDMQILNLVAHVGEQVTVSGTTAADSFSFAPTGSYMVTINGVDYHFEDSEVSGIVFTGADGNDEAVINGSAGDDSGTLSPNSGEFSIAGATVTVDNVTSVIVYGGGGLDDVRLFDSPGEDTLVARGDKITFSGPGFEHETHGLTTNLVYAKRESDDVDKAIFYDTEGRDKFKFDWPKPDQHFAKIYGSGYYNRAKYFEVVEVYFEGGGDIVKIFDSEGDDTFEAGSDSSRLHGDGYDVTVHGYEQLTVCASQGNDSAHFIDSPGDDLVRARSHKAMMWYGSPLSTVVTARRFDSYHFSAENGGYDKAKLHDTVLDDHLVAETDRATLYRNVDELDLLYEALDFEWIKAYGTPDSDTVVNRNTRDVADATDYDLLYWGQWD